MSLLPKIIDIDEIDMKCVNDLAVSYAEKWMKNARISPHKSVTPMASLSFINYDRPVDFLTFKVKENPFTLYVDSKSNLSEIKPIDFSFPEKCVSENVCKFFRTLYDHLNNNFEFNERIDGDITYVDKQSKITRTLKGFRPFFNFPDGSKSKNPTNVGGIRIDKSKKKNIQKYDIILMNDSNSREAESLQDLSQFIEQFATFKCTIRPSKITSSPIHFGNEYKIVWQLLKLEKLTDSCDDIDILRIMPPSAPLSSSPVAAYDDQINSNNDSDE